MDESQSSSNPSDEDVYEVEKIIDDIIDGGKTFYKVIWKGYGEDDCTWEPKENLLSCEDLLKAYIKEKAIENPSESSDRKRKNGGRSSKNSAQGGERRRKKRVVIRSMTTSSDDSDDADADEPPPHVKDPFWDMLQKGEIDVFKHGDMYSSVKRRRKSQDNPPATAAKPVAEHTGAAARSSKADDSGGKKKKKTVAVNTLKESLDKLGDPESSDPPSSPVEQATDSNRTTLLASHHDRPTCDNQATHNDQPNEAASDVKSPAPVLLDNDGDRSSSVLDYLEDQLKTTTSSTTDAKRRRKGDHLRKKGDAKRKNSSGDVQQTTKAKKSEREGTTSDAYAKNRRKEVGNRANEVEPEANGDLEATMTSSPVARQLPAAACDRSEDPDTNGFVDVVMGNDVMEEVQSSHEKKNNKANVDDENDHGDKSEGAARKRPDDAGSHGGVFSRFELDSTTSPDTKRDKLTKSSSCIPPSEEKRQPSSEPAVVVAASSMDSSTLPESPASRLKSSSSNPADDLSMPSPSDVADKQTGCATDRVHKTGSSDCISIPPEGGTDCSEPAATVTEKRKSSELIQKSLSESVNVRDSLSNKSRSSALSILEAIEQEMKATSPATTSTSKSNGSSSKSHGPSTNTSTTKSANNSDSATKSTSTKPAGEPGDKASSQPIASKSTATKPKTPKSKDQKAATTAKSAPTKKPIPKTTTSKTTKTASAPASKTAPVKSTLPKTPTKTASVKGAPPKARSRAESETRQDSSASKQAEEDEPPVEKSPLLSEMEEFLKVKVNFELDELTPKDIERHHQAPEPPCRLESEVSNAEFRQYIRSNSYEMVFEVLKSKKTMYNLEHTDSMWMTQVMIAAANGYSEIVKVLAYHGARVNARTKTGVTALMLAAERGHVVAVRHLLLYGAYVNLITTSGETALIKTVKNGHVEITRLLLQMGADPCVKTPHGESALNIHHRQAYLAVGHVKRHKINVESCVESCIRSNLSELGLRTLGAPIFPIRTYNIRECSLVQFSFSCHLGSDTPLPPNQGVLLFVVHGMIGTNLSVKCRLRGPCSVFAVTLNSSVMDAVMPTKEDEKKYCHFVTNLHWKNGVNTLRLFLSQDGTSKEKLLVVAYLVGSS